jgi:hypothetical protein
MLPDLRVTGGDMLGARVASPATASRCDFRQSRIGTGAAILACSLRLARIELEKLNHIDEDRTGLFHLVSEWDCYVAGAAAAPRRFSTCSRAKATWLFRMKSRCA